MMDTCHYTFVQIHKVYFADKVYPSSQRYGFSSSHVWMWETWALLRKLNTEELMVWTVVLERTLESPLDCKKIQPVHPEGNQSWIFIRRTDAEAETPIFWPPDAKDWLIGKDPDAGKDWRQEKKGMTEDEMVGWHHRLNGHEFEQALGVGAGQGSLVCCQSIGSQRVGYDWATEQNWTEYTMPRVNSDVDYGLGDSEVSRFIVWTNIRSDRGHSWRVRLCMWRNRENIGNFCAFCSILLWTENCSKK